MEEYKVILDFTDLEDGNRIYRAGDTYPYHNAADPSEERIESLLTDKNKRGEPLIESVSSNAENLEDLTVDELKERLDKDEIKYKSTDNKKALIKLLSE